MFGVGDMSRSGPARSEFPFGIRPLVPPPRAALHESRKASGAFGDSDCHDASLSRRVTRDRNILESLQTITHSVLLEGEH